MYFSTIEHSLKLLRVLGSAPDRGYGWFQWFLFLINILSGATLTCLLVMKYFFGSIPVTLSNIRDDVSYLFLFVHGFTKTITMFSNKSKMTILLSGMAKFWTPKETDLNEMKLDVLKSYEIIERTFRFFILMHCSNAAGFLVAAMVSKNDVLPFECHRPEWLGYTALLLYQEGVALLTILAPVVAMDIFFMSTVRLTEIQFRLLNEEIKNIFEDYDTLPSELFEANVDERITRCVYHHNFLLRYVYNINDTFSASLLIFRTIIIMSMCVEMYTLCTESDMEALKTALVYTVTGCIELMLCYCYPSQSLMDSVGFSVAT